MGGIKSLLKGIGKVIGAGVVPGALLGGAAGYGMAEKVPETARALAEELRRRDPSISEEESYRIAMNLLSPSRKIML